MLDINDFTRPAEDLAEGIKDVIGDQADKVKLVTTKALSKALGRFLAVILLMLVGFAVVLTLSFGFIVLIGDLIGSYSIGAFIVVALQLALFIYLFTKRKKLFVDIFVQLFIGIFYGQE